MKVYIKKIEGVSLPQRGSDLSAGYDIVATSDPKIGGEGDFASSHKRIDYIEYETNLFIAPSMVTTHTLIHPRSSISKYNLVLANSIGLVDNDYRGMVICRFKYIWQPEDFTIVDKDNTHLITLFGYINRDKIYKKGDKIAQLVFEPTIQVEFELVDDLTQTQRGAGGFGSTDGKIVPGPVGGLPIQFDETSNIAERFRKSNYTEPSHRKYEDIMREQLRD